MQFFLLSCAKTTCCLNYELNLQYHVLLEENLNQAALGSDWRSARLHMVQ